ncbi:hypothetical protein CEXT_698511 [Caerostris extrusa]|uniref:Uncharacterized protein n=1 Tax=Caerostris extrusa TaxID=172846 RepID=A0AAV4SA62_CAEEX|nr:hypothetical protein CEXT_698511 [Caerostris extrusa]
MSTTKAVINVLISHAYSNMDRIRSMLHSVSSESGAYGSNLLCKKFQKAILEVSNQYETELEDWKRPFHPNPELGGTVRGEVKKRTASQ